MHGSAPLQEIGRPRPSRRLPVVLTPDEVVRILGFLEGEHRLFAQLLYGTGMRISEGLQLRVKIWISITARSSCGRARAPGSGLDVTRELGTQPARAAVACTGMVAEGPCRGPQRRCASRRP
ncbi:tyrosine-type recombinase/integrase [Escherichia coli]|uniref:tyrosine-type recombinase/integrase n=1 Tax=Escherichia coli TaxID=562 RepID=UPI00388D920E